MLDWIILIFLALLIIALIVIAFIKRNKWIRIGAIIALQLVIILREDAIVTYIRNVGWPDEQKSTITEDFLNGVVAMSDFYRDSALLVYLIIILTIILCYRGFEDK